MLTQEKPQLRNAFDNLAGKRVVIVEDEGITQMQLRKVLTWAGLEVVGSASDGQAGVEIVLRERPDLVLMDINMPVMNGLEAAERILEKCSVCILMLTAYPDETFREQARRIGTSGYLLKPVCNEILLPQTQAALRAFQQLL